MYVVFVVLIFIFVILILISLGKRIPRGLYKSGIMIFFYKLSALFIDLFNKRNKDLLRIKKFAQLYPGENTKEQIREYEIKKLGGSFALLFLGLVLSLLMSISSLMNSPFKSDAVIERNKYGKGNKKVAFDIYADGELVSREEEINISERIYDEEQIEKIFLEAEMELDQIVLGDNKVFECIIYDLVFPETLKDGLITVEWELSNYSVVDRYGIIQEENIDEKGSVINISAKLKYFEYEKEHIINMIVYPKPENSEEDIYDQIIHQIKEYEKATIEYEDCILPTEIDGRDITYKLPEKMDAYILCLLFFVFSIVIYQAKEQDLDKSIFERDKQMLLDYPNIVSKFSLFISAGMTINAALSKINAEYIAHKNKKGKRYAYEELLVTQRELESGISESEAFIRFSERCRLPKYAKLASMLSQNIKRGNSGLIIALEREEIEAFEERKNMAKKLGEEAGTKLLVPMVIMLGIVMVIVIVPAFLSFSF